MGWSSTTCAPEASSTISSPTASSEVRPRWPRDRIPPAKDDGYLITLTTDMDADASYCVIFDAARFSDGPVCKIALPERIFQRPPTPPGRPGRAVAPLA